MQGGQKPVVLPDNANTVAVAPPAERFAYLPISVPSAAAAALRRAAAPALLPAAAGADAPVPWFQYHNSAMLRVRARD